MYISKSTQPPKSTQPLQREDSEELANLKLIKKYISRFEGLTQDGVDKLTHIIDMIDTSISNFEYFNKQQMQIPEQLLKPYVDLQKEINAISNDKQEFMVVRDDEGNFLYTRDEIIKAINEATSQKIKQLQERKRAKEEAKANTKREELIKLESMKKYINSF